MMDQDVSIEIANVTKEFKSFRVRAAHTTLKSQFLRSVLGKGETLPERKLTALHEVDLVVRNGMSVGCIGANGSGKSTLLKIAAGIYRPTTGRVTVRGKVASLLDLGAGFHPEFSGRENITLNGLILGLSRQEIRRRFDEIVDFSELGGFIDAPVRTYSSGMVVRLGFAIAISVDAEVLLIDEILSVGDEHFARKCEKKMAETRQKGTTILLVTHSLGTLEKWCDEAIWLDAGRVVFRGIPREVVARYTNAVTSAESRSGASDVAIDGDLSLRGEGDEGTAVFLRGGAIEGVARVNVAAGGERRFLLASILSGSGIPLFEAESELPSKREESSAFETRLRIAPLDIESGEYRFQLGFRAGDKHKVLVQRGFRVIEQRDGGVSNLRHTWTLTPHRP
ncbi:MAG: ABC transporter ATP-binding protein [Deltaproteobacteria bacterium]|nr:ABC transporter ATP-binding protein [Deltaproteobacteria bacterium]